MNTHDEPTFHKMLQILMILPPADKANALIYKPFAAP